MFQEAISDPGVNNKGFAAYIRLTLLKNTSLYPHTHSLRRLYHYSSIIELSAGTEERFGWRMLSMKPTVDNTKTTKLYGVIIAAQVISGELLDIFTTNGLSPYFIATAAGTYERHDTRASHWAFVPKTAKYEVHFSLAENGTCPNWGAFNNAIENHLCMLALSI